MDVASGRIAIAGAGHEPPLLIRADSEMIVAVEGGGPMLGVFSPLDLEEVEIELGHGDRLLLYTDGVTDAVTSTGELPGRNV